VVELHVVKVNGAVASLQGQQQDRGGATGATAAQHQAIMLVMPYRRGPRERMSARNTLLTQAPLMQEQPPPRQPVTHGLLEHPRGWSLNGPWNL